MRRLAKDNHGILATGQPPKLACSKHIHWPLLLVVQVTRGISHGTITFPTLISKQQGGQPSNVLILICYPHKRNEVTHAKATRNATAIRYAISVNAIC